MNLPNLEAGVWQHYKGNLYLILGYSRHTETEEVTVTYVPLYTHVNGEPLTGPRLCNRPWEMFFDKVLVTCPVCDRTNPVRDVITKGDYRECYCPNCKHSYEAQMLPRFRYIGPEAASA